MATKQRGRPRSFDRDTALEQATMEFWRRGYEVTSVADLTRVMGIGAPSLYAAFGDKQTLFEEVVRGYQATHGAFATRALTEEPTAREAVARLLREAAAEFTDPAHPYGCLVIGAAANCTTEAVSAALRDQRTAGLDAIESRIAADTAAHRLPGSTDAAALARFVATVFQGMSQQARDGATRVDLEAVAETAMAVWPEEPTPSR
ncbi:TetR/AcrR family transcriptional regulator [Streptomyces sp. NBC_00083]|uniref:TetR/AcrR family transcriptional regulator n=1 Tax=Streptomyces sp. NBC_00083 TaxID=2975647 RepID=UPI0022588758|nr:TetR/AcrR family transcriptional regulator [Streptomyces sp. NBC_00083]MCX5385588.1 TetR/AcrR family transcriptional regulator [Streptomyces sp. NBC_00083]